MRVERVETQQGPALYFYANGYTVPMLMDGIEPIERLATTVAISIWEGMRPPEPPFNQDGIAGWLERRRQKARVKIWLKSRTRLIAEAIRATREVVA